MLIASVCLIVCLSVTLVNPVKAVGWNELPFGRDTRVASGNFVLEPQSLRTVGHREQ